MLRMNFISLPVTNSADGGKRSYTKLSKYNKTAGFRPIPRWGERLRPLVSQTLPVGECCSLVGVPPSNAAIRCVDIIWYHSRTSTATKYHLSSGILAVLLYGCETLLLIFHMHCQRRMLQPSSHSRTSLYITLTSAKPPKQPLITTIVYQRRLRLYSRILPGCLLCFQQLLTC